MPGRARSVAVVVALVACGGASGLTRTQEAARRAGVDYLDLHAREAARAVGATYAGCPADQTSVTGSGEAFSVEACHVRVAVRCTWGAGAPVCTPEPELDAMRAAREEQAREHEAEIAAAARPAPPPPVAAAPRPSARAAAFRVGEDGVLALDAVADWLDLRARASSAHADSVLVSMTIRNGDSEACDHALTLTAAGEPLRFEAAQREGPTTHYVLDAAMFATLGDRVPLRATVCGQTLAFGHQELRALRAFIAADARMRQP